MSGHLSELCQRCEGDGYTETWNDDQSGVVTEICADCEGTGKAVSLEVRNYRDRLDAYVDGQ